MRHTLALIITLALAPVSPVRSASPADAGCPTATDLVARCASAMGGRAMIDEIKSLRIRAVYPDHGEHPLAAEIQRPNLSYSPQSKLAFDGTRACWLSGPDQRSQPELIDPGDLVDFDVEIAHFFPAFFDYPSEYAGTTTIGGRTAHRLRVTLPHGAVLVYSLDAETWLPITVNSRFTMRGRDFDVDRDYGDYRQVDGLLYPHHFTYRGRDGSTQHGRIASVEINPPLDREHFSTGPCDTLQQTADAPTVSRQ